MRRLRLICIGILAASLAGCVEDVKVVTVNADGSGTLEITKRMRKWALEEIRKAGGKPSVDDEDKAKARAAMLGEGVTFVSAEVLKDDEWEGIRSTYSFKDVSKLNIDECADGSGTVFRLARPAGGNAVLTVSKPFKKREPQPPQEDALKLTEEQKRALMAGLKMNVTVVVAGSIVKTNSPWVEGSSVTFLEVDFDQLVAEEARLKKLVETDPATLEEAKEQIKALKTLLAMSGGLNSLDDVRTALKNVKGVKILAGEDLSIEFLPK